MGIRWAFTGRLSVISMRMGVVVMPIVATVRMALLAGILMVPERHTLAARHRCHALERHGKD